MAYGDGMCVVLTDGNGNGSGNNREWQGMVSEWWKRSIVNGIADILMIILKKGKEKTKAEGFVVWRDVKKGAEKRGGLEVEEGEKWKVISSSCSLSEKKGNFIDLHCQVCCLSFFNFWKALVQKFFIDLQNIPNGFHWVIHFFYDSLYIMKPHAVNGRMVTEQGHFTIDSFSPVIVVKKNIKFCPRHLIGCWPLEQVHVLSDKVFGDRYLEPCEVLIENQFLGRSHQGVQLQSDCVTNLYNTESMISCGSSISEHISAPFRC